MAVLCRQEQTHSNSKCHVGGEGPDYASLSRVGEVGTCIGANLARVMYTILSCYIKTGDSKVSFHPRDKSLSFVCTAL